MEIDINWLAIVLAALSSFLVGFIWYMPSVFGNTWMQLVGMKKEDTQKGPGTSGWLKTAIGAILQAFVLYHVTYLTNYFYTDHSWFMSALTSAFWLWLGLQLSMLLTHDSFEQRPTKLTVLNAGNQLATLLVMALVIGVL